MFHVEVNPDRASLCGVVSWLTCYRGLCSRGHYLAADGVWIDAIGCIGRDVCIAIAILEVVGLSIFAGYG